MSFLYRVLLSGGSIQLSTSMHVWSLFICVCPKHLLKTLCSTGTWETLMLFSFLEHLLFNTSQMTNSNRSDIIPNVKQSNTQMIPEKNSPKLSCSLFAFSFLQTSFTSFLLETIKYHSGTFLELSPIKNERQHINFLKKCICHKPASEGLNKNDDLMKELFAWVLGTVCHS